MIGLLKYKSRFIVYYFTLIPPTIGALPLAESLFKLWQIILLEVFMGTVIYTATPLGAFAGALFLIGFLFVLGVFGAISAIFSRKERKLARIGTGCASIVLLLAFAGSTIATFLTWQNGDKTILVQALEKNEVTSNCNGNQCTSYVVETSDGRKHYVFDLNKNVWEQIEVDACYRFTYYPAKSLLGDYLQKSEQPSLYETTGAITRIEKVNCK
jgi:hypothetical protein